MASEKADEIAADEMAAEETEAARNDKLKKTIDKINSVRSEQRRQEIQLSLFNETSGEQYVGPNVVIRSSLFGLVAKGSRKYIKNEEIFSWGESKIHYEGEQLDQADFDAWMLLIKWCGNKIFEEKEYVKLEFPLHRFLKALGKSTGGKDRLWATTCLERLTGRLLIMDQYRYKGGLVHETYIDPESKKAVVLINPKLARVFWSGFTRLDVSTRLRLKGDLAKWLHAFLRTHKGPFFKISVTKLRDLVGAKTAPRYFKRNLKIALETLEEEGIVTKWSIDKHGNVLIFWEDEELHSAKNVDSKPRTADETT